MPIIRSMMDAMKKKYGDKKGESVYYAIENKMKKKGKFRSMINKAGRHGDLGA